MEDSYCWNNSCLAPLRISSLSQSSLSHLVPMTLWKDQVKKWVFKTKQIFHCLENFWLSGLKFYDNFESQEKSLFYFRHFSFSCLKAKSMLIADLPSLTAWIYTFCESLQSLEGNLYRRLARNPYDYLRCVYIIMSYYSYTFAPSRSQEIHHRDI